MFCTAVSDGEYRLGTHGEHRAEPVPLELSAATGPVMGNVAAAPVTAWLAYPAAPWRTTTMLCLGSAGPRCCPWPLARAPARCSMRWSGWSCGRGRQRGARRRPAGCPAGADGPGPVSATVVALRDEAARCTRAGRSDPASGAVQVGRPHRHRVSPCGRRLRGLAGRPPRGAPGRLHRSSAAPHKSFGGSCGPERVAPRYG